MGTADLPWSGAARDALAEKVALAAAHVCSDAFGATEVAPIPDPLSQPSGASVQVALRLGDRPSGWLRADTLDAGSPGGVGADALRRFLDGAAAAIGELAGEPAVVDAGPADGAGAAEGDALVFRLSGAAGSAAVRLVLSAEAASACRAGTSLVRTAAAVQADRDVGGRMGLLFDVPLEITVELGRTERHLRDVLDLVPGSIVELNRLAGDPVDVLCNGRRIARGEVVVVDESFGVRITEIPEPGEA